MSELLPKRDYAVQNGDNQTVARALRLLASMVETGPEGSGVILEFSEITDSMVHMNFGLRMAVEPAKVPGVMALLRTVQ